MNNSGFVDITVAYLQKLFAYNFKMNQMMIDNIRDLEQHKDKIITLLAHLLTAEKIWMMRLNGEDLSKQIIWPDLPLEKCQALLDKNRNVYLKFLNRKDNLSLNTNIVYTTSRGQTLETPIVDILMHVIIHSGYHRGQINALIRQAGGEPLNTDYIHYVRYMM